MAIYDALRDYLRAQRSPSVILTYREIERVIGAPLPMSAKRRTAWWANEDVERTRHVQCRAWQLAGYRATPDLAGEKIVFSWGGAR